MPDDTIQSPENREETPTVAADPDAPWGYKPDGTPYKRDPSAFDRLRGKPFGSQNGAAPPRRATASSGKPRASSAGPAPLAHDAKGYAAKFGRVFRAGAKWLSKKAPVDGAIVAVRAPEMAEAWGRVAVSYPKFGRLVDRFGKGGDLSDAIGGTLATALMIAHAHGLTAGTPLEGWLDEVVNETLQTFSTSPDFAGMREKMEARANAAVTVDVAAH